MSSLMAEVVYPVLRQDVTWTANGYNLPIADMERSHKVNVVRWLHGQATWLAITYWGAYVAVIESQTSENTFDSMVDGLDREANAAIADPHAWLDGTPLVRKLRADIAAEVTA